jgi:hypothetical protein
LSTTFFISQGERKLALLDVPRLLLAGRGLDEIGLAAEEGGRLDHVDHRGDFLERRVLVHVGKNRHADLLLHLGKNLQPLFHAGTAVALPELAVRLVERALENVGHAELLRVLLQLARDVEAELFALQRVRTAMRNSGLSRPTSKPQSFTLRRRKVRRAAGARVPQGRVDERLEQRMAVRGVEVNSGWNCTPTKNGWPGSSIISGRFSLGVRAETL